MAKTLIGDKQIEPLKSTFRIKKEETTKSFFNVQGQETMVGAADLSTCAFSFSFYRKTQIYAIRYTARLNVNGIGAGYLPLMGDVNIQYSGQAVPLINSIVGTTADDTTSPTFFFYPECPYLKIFSVISANQSIRMDLTARATNGSTFVLNDVIDQYVTVFYEYL